MSVIENESEVSELSFKSLLIKVILNLLPLDDITFEFF